MTASAESKALRLAPSAPPVIRFEHPDFWIVEKPAHLLIHPTRPDGEFTLLHWLQEREPDHFVALVNRLDRETSGLVLAARSAEAASLLGQMTMRREIQKSYLAIVEGKSSTDPFEINEPLGRLGISGSNPVYVRQAVLATGAPALTRVACLRAGERFSLVKLEAATGRLHQLRVHLASRGHPIVGDKIYGPDAGLYLRFIETGWTDELQSRLLLPRQALHASTLSFSWKGEPIHVESPLPPELQAFLDQYLPS